MSEIEATPPNGYTVVSTFSGAGGSCLGMRMAGFRVAWASEFVEAAQEVYRMNHPMTPLDHRDIREVKGQDILDTLGIKVGELDLLEGSPPCASFSLAGKREKGWGKVNAYSDTKQRVDDLFLEFARLIKEMQPKVFLAENVRGLISGVSKGMFKEFLKTFKALGYDTKACLLNAKWLGVPQNRERVFFMGVRNDLKVRPVFPKPLPYYYTVREAIPWIVRHSKSKSSGQWNTDVPCIEQAQMVPSDQEVSSTLLQGGSMKAAHFAETTKDAPDVPGTRLVMDSSGQWKTIDFTDDASPCVRASGVGHLFVVEDESEIKEGTALAGEWDKLAPGQKGKFLNFIKARPDLPCPTVTAMGGQPAASVAHPYQRRKFSMAELRRICAFPDDFKLTGSYSQQWERLGRAVPPVMMYHIASAVRDGVLRRIDRG